MFSRIAIGALSLVVASAVLMVAGCGPRAGGGETAANAASARRLDATALQPARLPYDKGSLILGGSAIPVDLERADEPVGFRFDLKAHGEVVEQEFYVLEKWGFLFRGVKGESYDPAIPLLRFPAAVGEQWTWGGKVLGPDTHDAKADISTSGETLNLAGGRFDAIRVLVEMQIGSRVGPPAERKLVFWFVPEKGIVKREFGSISTREPAPKGVPAAATHG